MSKNILLADDSLTIQKVIELTFMDEDFRVVSVGNGDEAVQKLKEMKPDLVIADVHMPGANGYEVCATAKEQHAAVPVLLLVGTFEPFDEAEYTACNADGYLKKPFDSQELLVTVEKLLTATSAAAASEGGKAGARPEKPAEQASTEPLELGAVEESPAAEAPGQMPGEVFPGLEGSAQQATPSSEETPEPGVAPAEEALPPRQEARGDLEAAAAEEEKEEVAEVHAEVEGEEEWVLQNEEETPGGPVGFGEPPATTEKIVVEEVTPEAGELELQEEPSSGPRRETAKLEDAKKVEETGAEAAEEVAPVEDYAFQLQDDETEQPPVAEDQEEPVPVSEPSMEEPEPAPSPPPAAARPAGVRRDVNGLSEADVDRIARRCVELLGEGLMREVAWEVIPDLAEVIIKDRLRELESQVE